MEGKAIRIGLIGDYDASVTAHRAIPGAIELAAKAAGLRVTSNWIATDAITDDAPFSALDAIWVVPASPYRSMDGALRAITFARTRRLPFLGTCAGFQHAVIEHARSTLGWLDADHAETSPDANRPVVSALACSLVEASETIRLESGSRLARAYGAREIIEQYRCNYGLNPKFAAELTRGPLRAAARDTAGEVRGIELDEHPFFVATLFQPERAALAGRVPPIVAAFVRAAATMAQPCNRPQCLTVRLTCHPDNRIGERWPTSTRGDSPID
ncbi:MAG TPA: CTP synthase [Gemmatimonadaceae bacterium]|nr:CTP synthase [Gemmatimonadaceae bacterium]